MSGHYWEDDNRQVHKSLISFVQWETEDQSSSQNMFMITTGNGIDERAKVAEEKSVHFPARENFPET